MDFVRKKTTTLQEANISHLGMNENPLRKVPKSRGYLNCLEGSWWFQPARQRVKMESIRTHHPDKVYKSEGKVVNGCGTQQVEWIHDMA